MEIRHATENDLPDLMDMGKSFFDASGFDRLTEYDDEGLFICMQSLMASGNAALLVADEKGKVVGMAAATCMPLYFSPKNKLAHEVFWWVREEARNLGAGKLLLAALEAWAKAQGASVVGMSVLSESEQGKVVSMYARAGYLRMETAYLKRI